MTNDYVRFDKFYKLLNKDNEITIKYKDKSKLMKVLGFILFFNSDFMTSYVTTIGSTVYFPSETFVQYKSGCISVLAHEYNHVVYSKDMGKFLFSFFYLFPQILAPIFFIGSIYFGWPCILIGLLLLLPWPSIMRRDIELDGYTMSMFIENELMKENNIDKDNRLEALVKYTESVNKQFTSSAYYFMWPFGVKKKLNSIVNSVINETVSIPGDSYEQAAIALKNSK